MDNAPHEDEPHSDEMPELERYQRRTCCIALVVCAVVLFILFVVAVAIPGILGARRGAPQSRAKGTLRSIGSSELAYRNANNNGYYGTFEDLQQDMFIGGDYTLGNFIENYTMTWEVSNTPAGGKKFTDEPQTIRELIERAGGNKFTIIAFPLDTRPGFLNTFAITEDQIVRVYNPANPSNKWESVTSWDPIL